MKGLLGKNLGMTQRFDDAGDRLPVTAIKCGPCTVVQKKSKVKEGYDALQLGLEDVRKVQNVCGPKKGHFRKAGTGIYNYLGELRLDGMGDINVGDKIGVEAFRIGDRLNIRGMSKGRGFQGVMKRHGMSGGGAAHGSNFHRAPGSIGMNSSPSRVFKNKKMPGHMGAERVTIKNLEVVDIDNEKNLLFVKGSVPGCKSGLLRIALASGDIGKRIKKKVERETTEVKTESSIE